MGMCYYIQKQPLRGVLEGNCFEICIQGIWQMPAGGFVFSGVAGYKPAALLEANFFMGVSQ